MSLKVFILATTTLFAGILLTAIFAQTDSSSKAQVKPKFTEADAKKEATSQLKNLVLAFYDYVNDHKTFPPAALVNKKGQALLSWRVLLLPYLGEEKLFREFKLTEAWDSPHNRMLINKMPAIFAPPWGENREAGGTPWQVFTGPGTIFDGPKGCSITEITDGTSNTILIVEARSLVQWSKPEDLPYDAKKKIPQMGFMFPRIFLFATADGLVAKGRRDFNENEMRHAIIRNDGIALGFEGIFIKSP